MNEVSPDVVEAGVVALGQRRINLIWECTQAVIALLVTLTALAAATGYTPKQDELVKFGFFLVIGFYFGRTNPARLGGGPGSVNGR